MNISYARKSKIEQHQHHSPAGKTKASIAFAEPPLKKHVSKYSCEVCIRYDDLGPVFFGVSSPLAFPYSTPISIFR